MVSNKWETVYNWVNELMNTPIPVQQVQPSFFGKTDIEWDVLRTDLIHPICSGNKLFKLKYYLLEAAQKNYTMIHTEGGPWSNHIVAAAFAAKQIGFSSLGMINGTEPLEKSFALQDAEQYGMDLHYKGWGNDQHNLSHTDSFFIPQGGYGRSGVKGAKEMIKDDLQNKYTHILCAVGTGTMLAGIAQAVKNTSVIGIPVLKNPNLQESIEPLSDGHAFVLNHNYHFGGYAKKTPDLLNFMNSFYRQTNIPTDFVYTGKLMYAIYDLIQKDHFPLGSKILAIHSGGLQGNRSLTKTELIF